jgi:hypothetical protein
MFTSNPYAELANFITPVFMQVYLALMILAVAAGTCIDMLHKGSARYFVQAREASSARATRRLSGAKRMSLAVRTLLKEVLTAGEFHNPRRRLSHLLTFYGVLLYFITTIVQVFTYPTPVTPAPAVWPVLWNIGCLLTIVGGGWFFFFIRVDFAREGNSRFRLIRADLFIVSLLGSVFFAFIWECVQATGNLTATQIFFGIYLFFTTLLFLGVPWSKFAHMFYKPVVAFQRRIEEADGSTSLPRPIDVSYIKR